MTSDWLTKRPGDDRCTSVRQCVLLGAMYAFRELHKRSQTQSISTTSAKPKNPHGGCAFMHQAIQPPWPRGLAPGKAIG